MQSKKQGQNEKNNSSIPIFAYEEGREITLHANLAPSHSPQNP